MKDEEFIRTEIKKVLSEASLYADKDNSTKKEFILRLKDKVLTLFEILKKPKAELASFIWNKLEDIQFSINQSWFEKWFTEDEKRNYYPMYATTQFIETDREGVFKNPQTAQIKIDEITYSPDLPSEAKPKTMRPEVEDEVVHNKYTDLLRLIGDSASKLEVTVDAILQRYDDNVELIHSALEPIQDKQKQYAHYYAVIANSKDVMDDRNKWGDYEKIMAKFEMDGGETIAHISKLMDYSSKFGSIGILNNPELQKKVEQLGNCPKCSCNIYFEINESLKEQEKIVEFEI